MLQLSDILDLYSDQIISSNIADFEIENISLDKTNLEKIDVNTILCVSNIWIQENLDFLNKSNFKNILFLYSNGPKINTNYLMVKEVPEFLGEITKLFYNDPSTNLNLVGVTGTNGKTTTSNFINQIWKLLDYKTLFVGTTGIELDKTNIEASHTTPDIITTSKLMNLALEKNVDNAVMEVSSHALDQKRTKGLHFKVAAFTSFSQDHLDYHKDMQEYFNAKLLFFEREDIDHAVLPSRLQDLEIDYSKQLFFACAKRDIEVIGYSLNEDDHSYSKKMLIGKVVKQNNFSMDVLIKYFEDTNLKSTYETQVNIIGLYNLENLLAAIGSVMLSGIEFERIMSTLSKLETAVGRSSVVNCGQNFGIIIDYAHTPDALEKILISTKKNDGAKQIIVFGCGGNRDPMKRSIMGEIAFKYSDLMIVADDNPRDEDPSSIRNEIISKLDLTSPKILNIGDRKIAIETAISKAQKNDLVIIAGKGHETTQTIGNKVLPFDDKEVVIKILEKVKE